MLISTHPERLKSGKGLFAGIIAVLLLGMLVVAISVTPANSAVMLSEKFDGNVSGTVQGGRFVPSFGPGESGWQGTVDQTTSNRADYIAIPISDGVQFSSEKGTLEFWLKNDRIGGFIYKKPDITYNTVLQFTGDDFNLPLYFLPTSDRGWSESALVVWGREYMKKKNPYGFYNNLGRLVQIGEWIHVALTWGPVPADNNIYIDGNALELIVPEGERINFGQWIKDSHTLKIGADSTDSSYPDGAWQMYNLVIDDLIIHDEVITDFDLSRLHPEIDTITHDAFQVAGYSGKLVAGDTFKVIVTASSGGKATFDLGKIKDHPMTETTPGEYTAIHVVKYGEDVEDGQVVGSFTSYAGMQAPPKAASRIVDIDTRIYLNANASNDLIPADREARSGITIVAADANGKNVKGHELKLTLSTTDEYTGTVGGGSFEDLVGGTINVDWGGITDSFGEVTAQYVSGFAAKTILVSAKDMTTGDVGVGFVRSYIDGTMDIVITQPTARALSVAGSLDVSLSRDWLTADGRSRSRITAVVEDSSGKPVAGHSIRFTLLGENGEIRIVQGKTDSRGRATADYIAGTVMGQVQVEVRDLTSGMTVLVPIELRPDAPAEIILSADPAEVVTGGESTISARITDANGNPNQNVDVLYNILVGSGELEFPSVATNEKGNAPVVFTAGNSPGLVTVKGTVISREPSDEEISAAEGAVFMYGLEEDPGRLDVVEWFVEPGEEVVEGQGLVVLEDRADITYTVVAPRDGIVSTFVAEERDRVEYGDTLGYVIEIPE